MIRLSGTSDYCLVLPLSEKELEHALAAGWANIRDLALQQAGPELEAGCSPIWRVTGPSVPPLPTEIPDISTIDHLLGRKDAREPLVIRKRGSTEALNFAFHVPADFPWFEGHFPGEPILPGIAQLWLAIGNARALTGHSGQPTAIQQLKFKAPMRPDQVVELNLQSIDGGENILFSYRSATGEHASGRLAYGAR